MYLPATVYFGSLPLLAFTAIGGGIIALGLLARLGAPERDADLLLWLVVGAVLGTKAVYLAADPATYLAHPEALLFTPRSPLGTAGMAAGAAVGGILGWREGRGFWNWADADALLAAVLAWVAVGVWGWNLVGAPIPVALHRLGVPLGPQRLWPSYAVAGLGSGAALAALLRWRAAAGDPDGHRRVTGLGLLAAAAVELVVLLTLPAPGPASPFIWAGAAVAVAGWRLTRPPAVPGTGNV
ncbi:MAG: hypothetical protein OWV35_02350 [Firmicutes bacterium]|nr:hypothetical protein [Bacillota bacterium]